MGTVKFPSPPPAFAPPDLEGAFNDGYQLSAERIEVFVGRWAVIAWSIAAWCIGSLFIAAALMGGASRLWHWIK